MFDYWGIPVIVGAAIFVLGIILLVWGIREEKNYYDSMVSSFDLREFFSRWPPRVEPGALRTGGWIAMVLGIIIAAIGGFLYWSG